MDLKNVRRGRISEYAEKLPKAKYTPTRAGTTPCGTSRRLRLPVRHPERDQLDDAKNLVKNGVHVVSEGANMPTTPEGVDVFLDNGILYGPGKAANAGGVAVSGLEMSQNSHAPGWTREEVDNKLHSIMQHPRECVEAAKKSARRATTSTAPTSPASSRSPTR
jgi:glutamate dehydrogenase (NADP+)